MRFILEETFQKYSQTSGVRNEIDEILEPVLLALRIYGLQILNLEWTWKKYGLYRIINFILLIYVTIGTINICSQTEDFNIIIEGFFTIIINVQMMVKIFLFLAERKKFQTNYLRVKTYFYDLLKDYPQRREKMVRNLKRLVMGLFFVILVPVLSYLVIALWFAFHGNRVTLSRSTSTLMPNTTPFYQLGLIIHLHYLVEAAFCLMSVDLWFIMMCCFFFEASEISMEYLDVERDGIGNEEYAKRLDDSLRKFYELHVKSIEFLNLLNDMYKWICLVPIVAILLETSFFLMLIKEELNLQVGTVMLPAVSELLAYNWFGEMITTTADNINYALLNFDWTSMRLQDQKKYYIMTCYMNKKISIRTAFGTDLSLLTLSTIYKMSYQMFTVFSTT